MAPTVIFGKFEWDALKEQEVKAQGTATKEWRPGFAGPRRAA